MKLPLWARPALCSLLLAAAACGSHDARLAAPCPSAPTAQAADPLANHASILPESASPVGFERIAKFPEPGWQVPRALAFGPDQRTLTYLSSETGGDHMALWALDPDAKAPRVLLRASDLAASAGGASLAQELRDERQRKRIKGITEYQWAKSAPVLLVPFEGELFLRTAQGEVKKLAAKPGALDPKLCPDGSKVIFVRDGELFALDVDGSRESSVPQGRLSLAPKVRPREVALTRGAAPGVTRGLSDFLAQEEFDEPSGFFLSPDCKRLVYLEVDERGVKERPVAGYRAGAAQLMMQRYPRVGEPNPKVSLHLYDFASRRSRPLPLAAGIPADAYLGRFRFTPDGNTLVHAAIERSQRRGHLAAIDLGPKPAARLLATDAVEQGWVEMRDVLLSADGKEVLTLAPRDGHWHVRATPVAAQGASRFLTGGAFDVIDLLGTHAARGSVLISATRDEPIGRRPFELAGDGSLTPLSEEPGTHDLVASTSGESFADVWSSRTKPPAFRVVRGGVGQDVPLATDPEIAALGLRPAELLSFDLPGRPRLHAALLAPRKVEAGRRYPLLLSVYGGPGVQTVMNRWAPRLQWQHLADRGVFVLQVDNRGSFGRGPAFEQAVDRRLGQVELEDQLAVLSAVLERYPVDPARVAISGHSYGGFMAAYAMTHAPGRFALGVAASPVTDWRLYDSGYTERYMGTPAENPSGYDAADLERAASKLEGKLVLIHALLDENVHFQNSADLVDALVREKKDFEMFVFPGERHGYRAPEARAYAAQLVVRKVTGALGP